VPAKNRRANGGDDYDDTRPCGHRDHDADEAGKADHHMAPIADDVPTKPAPKKPATTTATTTTPGPGRHNHDGRLQQYAETGKGANERAGGQHVKTATPPSRRPHRPQRRPDKSQTNSERSSDPFRTEAEINVAAAR